MKQFFTAALFILTFSCFACNCFSQSVASANNGFIENKGQIIDQDLEASTAVKFLLCRSGFNVQLRKTGFSYDTYTDEKTGTKSVPSVITSMQSERQLPQFSQRHFHRVDIELLNCNPNAQLIASGVSTSYFNYFTGIKEDGIRDVRNYQKIIYKEIYPHIDLEFFTQRETENNNVLNRKSSGVEYQFVIHPGGNVNDIKLFYCGADKVFLENNEIKVQVTAGTFTENIPSSYLKESGQKVDVTYVASGTNLFSFHIPSNFNITSDLVIDPTPNLLWGTYYGGSSDEAGTGIGTDALGNVYITGYTESVNNIATAGAYQTTLEGSGAVNYGDAFVAKFNPTGDSLLWGTYYGGGINYNNAQFGKAGYTYGGAYANGIAVDAYGNSYITGSTTDSNGIATQGAHQILKKTNGSAAFVAKFTANGALCWGTFYGQPYQAGKYNSDTQGQAIVLDANGSHVYITGTTADYNGIATSGTFSSTFSGATVEAFAAEFDTSGANLLWGTYFADNSGNGRSFGVGITLDTSGNVFITGNTGCTDLATAGAYKTTLTGIGTNAFIAKFNPNLKGASQLLWCTLYGGNVEDYGQGIAVDADDNVYVTGNTYSDTGVATKGAFQDSFKTYSHSAYVVKLNSTGSKRVWGTYFGRNGFISMGSGIAVDACNNVYISGYSDCTGMATAGAYQTTFFGATYVYDAFVAKFDSSASSLLWGSYYGGAGTVSSNLLLNNNNLYIVGSTTSTSDISTNGVLQTSYGGGSSTGDAFAAEFNNIGICTACTLRAAQIRATKDSICAGNSTTLSAITRGGGSIKYSWSPGGQNKSSIQVSPIANTKYIVTALDTVAGCSRNDSITITVLTGNVTPALTISSSNTPLCPGEPVTFSAAPVNGGGAPSYQWKVNNQNAGTNSNKFTDSNPATNDVVTCVLTSSVACASPDTAVSNSVTLTVNPQTVAGTVSAVKDSICENTIGHLIVSGSSGGTIQWQSSTDSLTGFTNISGAMGNTLASQPLTHSTYFRVVVGVTCADTSNSFKINTQVAPVAHFTYSVDGQQVTFDGSGSAGATRYLWNFADGSPTSSLVNPSHTYDSVKAYHVCLTVKNNSNCNFTLCENVTTNPTGVNNINIENNWLIYPDPFINQLYINSQALIKITRIGIYDVLGRRVIDEPITNETVTTRKLDVSGLGEGVYYLRISTQNGDYIKSIIKQ